jgi:hypothetical protein
MNMHSRDFDGTNSPTGIVVSPDTVPEQVALLICAGGRAGWIVGGVRMCMGHTGSKRIGPTLSIVLVILDSTDCE